MKLLTLFLLTMGLHAQAGTQLLSCSPVGGQLSQDKSQYTTYDLELTEEEGIPILLLRKGFLSNADQTYIVKELYLPALAYRQFKSSFALGYEAMGDKFLIFGGFWKNSSDAERMATVRIRMSMDNTVESLRPLLVSPSDIDKWQCLINTQAFAQFSVNKEAETEP